MSTSDCCRCEMYQSNNRCEYVKVVNNIKTVYVTHQDRLTRFGYKYLKRLLALSNVELISLHETISPPHPQEELIRDFMSLLASFSGKYYRLRGKENSRKFLEQVEADLNGNTTTAGDES